MRVHLAAYSNAVPIQNAMGTAQCTNYNHSRECRRHHAWSEDCFSPNALFVDCGPGYLYKSCLMFKKRVNILDLFIHHPSPVQIHGSLSQRKKAPPSFCRHTRRSTLAMQNPGSLEKMLQTPKRVHCSRLSPPQVPVESKGRRFGMDG